MESASLVWREVKVCPSLCRANDAKKRSKLILPTPQISDAELEEVCVCMGACMHVCVCACVCVCMCPCVHAYLSIPSSPFPPFHPPVPSLPPSIHPLPFLLPNLPQSILPLLPLHR